MVDWAPEGDDLGPIEEYSWDSAYSYETDDGGIFELYMR